MKTILGGGGYQNLKFFVNDNSGVYESSTLATVAIGLIPLLWWFVRHGTIFRPHWTVTAFAVGLTFACLLVPIGTEARTGLLCIAALGVLLLRYTKRRLLFIMGAGVLGLTALHASRRHASGRDGAGFLMGFAAHAPHELEIAVKKLASVLRALCRRSP